MNKKYLYGIASLCVAFSLVAFAEETNPVVEKTKREMIIEKMGGYVQRPDLKTGKVIFVNTQDRVSTADITSVVDGLNHMIHTKMTVVEGEPVTLKTIAGDMKAKQATAAIYIVNCSECENVSLISPESKWALINVGAICADGVGDAYVAARTRKEIVRTFSTIFGAPGSTYNDSLLGPISSVKDLDNIASEKPPMDVMGRVRKYLDSLDVETRAEVTYFVACKEGWAPAPVNDIQREIWEKFNAKPSKPMKIKPGDKPAK